MKAQILGTLLAGAIATAHAGTPYDASARTPGAGWQQAQNTPSPDKDGAGSGSGSTGMAPQQGTGSGATQQAPSANKAETGKSPAPAPDSPANREFGRETSPTGQPMHKSNPDKPKQQ